MSLPSSGQIAFSDVRTEMSQSSMTSYAMSGWTWGYNVNFGSPVYTPINVLSS